MINAILQNKRILVVEDNSINQMLVKHTLQKTGAEIDIAEHGGVALEFLKKGSYDLVLMDLQMPEMDGFETAEYIRREMGLSLPIIAMSAMMFANEEQRCLDVGMNGYLLKPFSLDVFFDVMRQAVQPEASGQSPSASMLLGDERLSIDISVLYNLGGADASYISVVVQTFLENMPDTIGRMKQSLAAGDADTLMRTAHFAKSSLSVIRIHQVFDRVQRIEALCRHGLISEELQELVGWIDAHYPAAEKLLKQHFNLQEVHRDSLTA